MVTVSLCMIVKNEEKSLPACLDSLRELVDEMIIVDTGSEDKTVEIARAYGAQIYTYQWTGDFSAARNYAFSKANCDYIYSADADEVIDSDNQAKFKQLKEDLDSDIDVDIVQMYYCNQLAQRTVYNYDRELRPKLFKRLRSFVWYDQIHEQVKLEPTICNSDIDIIHNPSQGHAARDLAAFRRLSVNDELINKRLHSMYTRELFMAGSDEDFRLARDFFLRSACDTNRSGDEVKEASCVLVHIGVLDHDPDLILKYALKDAITEMCTEMCYELGTYYKNKGDLDEAIVWFYNAAYETSPIIDIHRSGDLPRRELADCYTILGNLEEAADYQKEADEWQIPENV